MLDEIGFLIFPTLFGADSIIWVEGPTEVDAFSFLSISRKD